MLEKLCRYPIDGNDRILWKIWIGLNDHWTELEGNLLLLVVLSK